MTKQKQPPKGQFRVNRKYPKILRKRKERIQRRLDRQNFPDPDRPTMRGSNIQYDMSDRVQATGSGGIGAIHLLAQKLGIPQEIDETLELLKVHLPYHESDHVLNIAYNVMTGGMRLEDIELLRQDESYLNGLGAERIPDPTTAGDFTRRFAPCDITELQECFNRIRQRVWQKQPKGFLEDAFIDIDGTIAGTYGECKHGMGLSYKGIWGYAPLIISLANTKEGLYLVNRPGNETSNQGCVEWIDRAINLVKPFAGQITLRGDTAFSNTSELDRWDEAGIKFLLGMKAMENLDKLADALSERSWRPLKRLPKYEVATEPRDRPDQVKEKIVKEKGYENIKLIGEEVSDITYQPTNCNKAYRLVILKKNLSVQKGEKHLFDDIRYFFFITNRWDLTPEEIIALANDRCDQENLIEQYKNGVNAMRMPVDDLESNWAYMVIAALAWNLKAWFALLVPDRKKGLQLLKMEFRSFLHAIIQIPCQVVRTARRIVYRVLGYNPWMDCFFATFNRIRALSGP